MKQKQVKVFAPATISNIGPGFDVLGVALDAPGDIVIAERRDEKGLVFHLDSSNRDIPADQHNVAAHVAGLMLEELNPPFGISLTLQKSMPIGSGLGSSGASCAAAALAVNALLLKCLNRKDLIKFAVEGERLATGAAHADNVAPALLGGICLVRSYHPLDVIQLPAKNIFHWVVVHPHIVITTKAARKVLPSSISLSAATDQWGNLAALVTGFIIGDKQLVSKSIIDHVAEPVRAKQIPGFEQAKQAALKAGALAFSISGSGPSVFAITTSLDVAKLVSKQIKQAFFEYAQLECDIYISKMNQEGAKILETSS